jgi:hypothetical protein
MALNDKPTKVPEYAILDQVDPVTGQNNVVEPTAAKKNYGFDYLEKPPRNTFNWLFRFIYLWINYFNQFFSSSHQLKINEIIEEASAGGVTIDGVLLKDGDVTTDHIIEKTVGHGVDIDGVNCKDNKLTVLDTTDSTTKDTGSIITEGGIGTEKNIVNGGYLKSGLGRKPTGSQDGYIFNDNGFALFTSWVPNINDEIIIHGFIHQESTNKNLTVSRMKKTSSSTITIYGGRVSAASDSIVMTSGETESYEYSLTY